MLLVQAQEVEPGASRRSNLVPVLEVDVKVAALGQPA